MSGPQPLAEPPFVMPFAPGQIVGQKYQIIEMLGVGGVGFVVAANHIELGEKVALKFLKPEMLANPEVVARFAHEALAAVRIKSEHVARVFDVGSMPDGSPFIVMEFLNGRDLFDVVTQDGPQPIRRAVDYVLQACEALADAHACGVVHRDIKPENLFLLQRSEGFELIKVLDFGISKLALTGSAFVSKVPLVRTTLPMGSPVYMSPEQIRASADIDCRTDIWSMGCVLYELLTGHAAFDAPSLTQLSATILEQNPSPPSFGQPGIPIELDAVVSRCLEKSPNNRYQNVAELAMALYPFGPRRARVAAERCCLLLKVAGTAESEFELPSVRPLGWDGLASGSFPTPPKPVSRAADGVADAEEVKSFHPVYRSKKVALYAGCLIGAIVAAFIGLRSLTNQPVPETSQVVKVQPDSPPNVALPNSPNVAPAPVSGAQNGTNSAARANTASSVSVTASAIPAARAPVVAVPANPRRLPARPARVRKSASGESAPSAVSDPDPGF
jgi:serine/threonine-protein kinase